MDISPPTQQPRPGRRPFSGTPQRAQQRAPERQAVNWRPRRGDAEVSGEDDYYVPPEVIPAGMSWEWKRYSTHGEVDITHQARLARDGAWDVVTHDQWPDKLGKFGKDGSPILLGGQVLMQRPLIYTEEAQAEEQRKATGRVKDQFRSLALGDGPLPKMKPSVKKDYSSVQLVPADDEVGDPD